MSQNAHTLLLFFSKEEPFRKCLKVLRLLDAEKNDQAEELSRTWGVDFATPWNADWFNHCVSVTPKFIRVQYDTSSSYELPLELLQELFDAGLRVACLEVYYDQLGEYGHFHFMDSKLVDLDLMCNKYGLIRHILSEQFECDIEETEGHGYPVPASINKLIKERGKREEESAEMVDALVGLAKASRESGVDPLALAKSALVLRALVKGVLQGVGFGIITVLLFKGMWLWIGLSVVLTIVLPLIYVSKVSADFEDEPEEGGAVEC
ncbi:hypothetical protein SAMN02745866_01810 [Alteromonadaceae bacterium Bs31]|nr:hypothetical protein SAMN02745866_01810 [Alteromonadaceae bacterium Bs31]